jgi:hypothetical protein
MDEDMSDAELLESLRYRPELESEKIEDGPARRQKREAKREVEPFLLCPIRELQAGAQAVSSAGELLVWLYIVRERRVRLALGQPEAFALTNVGLSEWGIHRTTKARAVVKLAAAGLIKVERSGRRSPKVTVCGVR